MRRRTEFDSKSVLQSVFMSLRVFKGLLKAFLCRSRAQRTWRHGLQGRWVLVVPLWRQAELVERIKALQRTDPNAKQNWWSYCDTHLKGAKDPNRHDESTLADFLALYDGFEEVPMTAMNGMAGPRTVPPRRRQEPSFMMSTPPTPMVECIKTCQRSSTYWRTAWQAWHMNQNDNK